MWISLIKLPNYIMIYIPRFFVIYYKKLKKKYIKTVLDASCYTSCISGLQTVLNSPLKTTPNDKIYSLCYNKCTKREKRDWYE
jgi:hypothetical protein